jgi:hypothetical protein
LGRLTALRRRMLTVKMMLHTSACSESMTGSGRGEDQIVGLHLRSAGALRLQQRAFGRGQRFPE